MKRSAWNRIAHSGLALAAALILLGPLTGRAAEGGAEPARTGLKALLEEALQDWDDPIERQAILREIHDVFSARLVDLQGLAERHWEEAQEMAEHLVEQASQLVDLRADQPREYERRARLLRLENETVALAQKARAAVGAARAAITAELNKKLAESFDAKQEALQRDLATMEAEAENLRRRLAKRAASRDQLIERRALDLLGDNDVEW